MVKKHAKWILMSLAVFLVASYGCKRAPSSKTNNNKPEETGIPVETAEVIQGSISAVYSSTSTLEAEAEAEVVAKVAGVVKKIFAEEGDLVREGETLAKLDDDQFVLEVNQAKSALEKLANDNERNEILFKSKIISQEAYEKSKLELHVQQAAYDLARLKLDYTEIKAPISGVVSIRHIKAGNMVTLNQPVFRITDFDPLLAVLHIPENELSKLRPGFPVKLSADALPGEEFKGSILRISPVINAGTGTFKVTVEVKDPARRLKPGMFTRAQIIYDTHSDTLLVPKNAVLTEDNETTVFLVAGDHVSKSKVEAGYTNARHVEILTGLKAGDVVVTTGLSSLKDGVKIKIVNR